MSLIKSLIFDVKNWVSKTSKYLKSGYLTKQKLNLESMTGRKLDDENENLPSKKLCSGLKKEEEANNEDIMLKVKKRNVALLLAYCGANYWGMQKNPSYLTIESELLNALLKANLIPASALEEMYSIHFQRAARTDKGVSAAKQVVSFKIFHNYNVESINSFLPDDIRVFSIKRVTKGFNCKNDCFARTYSYTLPSFALAPELHKEYPKDFRIEEDMIKKANEILNTFVGTHNFHNFTSKKNFKDPSAKRFIIHFKIEETFINNEEFIKIVVKGQSFMLHQIRKMIGHTIAVIKGIAPLNWENDIWKEQKFFVPMAPGLGLVLEDLHYDNYDKKFGNDGIHEPLIWDEIKNELDDFKKKFILSKIINKEIEEKIMFNWIQSLICHHYESLKEEDTEELKS